MFVRKTQVPAEKSIGEIKRALLKFGCKNFQQGNNKDKGHISFTYEGKKVRINFSIPPFPGADVTIAQMKKYEKATNIRWREILICIKGKLESVATEIETFEEAFMAHIDSKQLQPSKNAQKISKLKRAA